MLPKIECHKLNKTISAEQDKSVFQNLKDNQIPIASSCGGKGVCKWCRITIHKGYEKLSKKTNLELKAPLKENERLSCQIYINSDVMISTTYW